MHFAHRSGLRPGWSMLACLLVLVLGAVTPRSATADTSPARGDAGPGAGFSIDWLEPRGLNIVDLVGQIPDAYLNGSVISYTPGYGIVRYESGRRNGDVVTITAKAHPRFVMDRGWYGSMFSCLGQGARMDQLGSVSPASTARVYHEGRDVTREVLLVSHVPATKSKPTLNPKESEWQNRYRYPETDYRNAEFTADNQVILPANMGCELIISMRNYREITVVFTVNAPRLINAQVVGTESFTFHSYLGPGLTGLFNALIQQLQASGYGFRAERFDMNIPPAADYFFLNFPPMPVDPYTQFLENPTGNADRLSSGTYRISIPSGLSVDHVNAMGLPLRGHWQDIDQADGVWLNYANQHLQLSAPEYFVPTDVSFHACMINGGCSAELLHAVYTTPMTMKIIYLEVQRVSTALERLPVRMVGSKYHAAAAAAGSDESLASAKLYRTYLPTVRLKPVLVPPDDASDCSWEGGCGWFAADGRMVDYIPRP